MIIEALLAPNGDQGINGNPGGDYFDTITEADLLGTHKISQQSLQIFAKYASFSQLSMALHCCELLYLNDIEGNLQKAATILEWINAIATCNSQGDDGISPPREEWSFLQKRVSILQNQISAGFDFYGLPRSYVPLVDKDIYEKTIRKLLDDGQAIENDFEKYSKKFTDIQDYSEPLQETLNLTLLRISKMTSEINIIENDATEKQNSIAMLSAHLNDLTQQLELADFTFKKAVEKQGQGCSFVQILDITSSIVVHEFGG